MIKVENMQAWGFEHAIRGMRNPLNSWDRSDTTFDKVYGTGFVWKLGENDLNLMRRLYKAGTEHRKYLRQIFVSMDITAPTYWIAELDTYKVGTTRNSCSFMHKGVSEPFKITDFSVHDERVYEALTPNTKLTYELTYPYETDDYRIYTCANGRTYKVYRNGRVFAEKFEYTDTMGRHRVFEEKECKPSKTNHGYFELNLGGGLRDKWMLHRLVATVWLDNPDNLRTVNHKDCNKGNNCVENLEWCSLEDNIKKAYEDGVYDVCKSLRTSYLRWKNNQIIQDPFEKTQFLYEYRKKILPRAELAKKYNITPSQASNILNSQNEQAEFFTICRIWEEIIDGLNQLRDEYLETKDERIFQQIRCLLPSGYNQKFTITMNYENVISIIKQRKGHRLDEWSDFIEELKKLPYIKEIMNEDEGEKEE